MQSALKKDELKANLKNTSVWKRLFFMLLFAVLYSAAEVVLVLVVLYQFLSLLITAEKNQKVLTFGAQISTYAYQIFSYLTFNSEVKPFPMGDWPSDQLLIKPVCEPADDLTQSDSDRETKADDTVAKSTDSEPVVEEATKADELNQAVESEIIEEKPEVVEEKSEPSDKEAESSSK